MWQWRSRTAPSPSASIPGVRDRVQDPGVILVSSELPEVLGMSDRVLVMRQGRVVAELDRADADQETVVRWATAG